MSKSCNVDRILIPSTALEEASDLTKVWRDHLDDGDDFLIERAWNFTDERRNETASVIGHLITTHLSRFSELQDVSCAMIDLAEMTGDPDISITQLALIKPDDTEFLAPGWVAWNIIELVNTQLNVVKSPYELSDQFPMS